MNTKTALITLLLIIGLSGCNNINDNGNCDFDCDVGDVASEFCKVFPALCTGGDGGGGDGGGDGNNGGGNGGGKD